MEDKIAQEVTSNEMVAQPIKKVRESRADRKQRINIFKNNNIQNHIPFLMFSITIGITWSYLFDTIHIPKISLLLFVIILVISSLFMLREYKLIKNSKAYQYLIPVLIILIGNVIFSNNTFINILTVIILLVIFYLKLLNINYNNIYGLGLLLPLFTNLEKNLEATFSSVISPRIKKVEGNSIVKVLIGIVISLPLLLIIFQLLISSDQVFAELVYNLDISSEFSNGFKYILRFIISFYIFQLIFLYFIKIKDVVEHENKQFKGDNIIIGTILILINLLFALFCYVQLRYLVFGGNTELPGGITYAAYARSGFFQLLFVTIINYTVILLFTTKFKKIVSNKFINSLMILLGTFTILLIFSSFYRMNMYISAYGYTILRLQVITFLCMELLILIMTIVKIKNDKYNISKIVSIFLLLGIFTNIYLCNDFIASKFNFSSVDNFEIRNDEMSVDNYLVYDENNEGEPNNIELESIKSFEWREATVFKIIYHLNYR